MTDESRPAIRAQGIRKVYEQGDRSLAVLDGVDLELEAAASVALMGPSGSGKSTLLHILGTLDDVTEGTLELNGADPSEMNDAELADFRNRSLGFVFQDHYLLPQCSALENVLVPTLAGGDRAGAEARATQLLERLGLADRADHMPSQLSGGERQRVAIARALIRSPKILLCDEPTGSVDEDAETDIADAFEALVADEGVALAVVTHNRRFADRFERVMRLSHGRLIADGGA